MEQGIVRGNTMEQGIVRSSIALAATLLLFAGQAQSAACQFGDAPFFQNEQNYFSGGKVQFYQDKGCFPDEAAEKVSLPSGIINIGETGYGSVGVNNDAQDLLFS